MAEEVGAAFVSLIPSARGFSRLAQREINKALPNGGLVVPIRPEVGASALTGTLPGGRVTIPAAIDLDRTQVVSALVDVTGRGGLMVDAGVDTAGLVADTRRAVGIAQASAPTIDVDVDVDRPGMLGRLLGRIDVGADGQSLGQRLGLAALTGLGNSMQGGLNGALGAIASNPIVSTTGIALGLGIGAAAATAIPAAITAGILGGAGLGAISLGAFILKDDPLLAQALSGFKGSVGQILREAAQPLRDPLILGLDTVLNSIQKVAPDLERMFAGIAPYVQPLAEGIGGFIEAFTPGLVDAVIASGPVLEQIAYALPDLGDALGDFLRSISSGGPEAGQFIGMFIRGLGDILRILGVAIAIGARLFGLLAASMSGTWAMLKIGINLISILGAVIMGDFGAAKVWLQDAIGDLIRWLRRLWDSLSGGAEQAVGAAVRFVKGLPGKVKSAVGDLGNLLYNAGKNIVQGLINGIRAMLGKLGDVASSVAGTIKNFFPSSPAKEGPLSGSGSPYHSGQTIATMLAGGMQSQLPTVASAGNQLAGAVGLGAAGGRSASGVAPAAATARWADGSSGDQLLDALRDMIRIDFGGSPTAALGST